MRVLGVDPGLTRCGVGVIDGVAGRRATMVHVEVVRTPVDGDIGSRLLALDVALTEAVQRFRPDVVAVERVFAQHNVRTVMGTAQASAVAITVAARAGIPVALHTPSEVKAAVTGSGRADKAQVITMVTRLLGLEVEPRPADAADSLALALCHLWRAPVQARLAAAATQNGAVQQQVAAQQRRAAEKLAAARAKALAEHQAALARKAALRAGRSKSRS